MSNILLLKVYRTRLGRGKSVLECHVWNIHFSNLRVHADEHFPRRPAAKYAIIHAARRLKEVKHFI